MQTIHEAREDFENLGKRWRVEPVRISRTEWKRLGVVYFWAGLFTFSGWLIAGGLGNLGASIGLFAVSAWAYGLRIRRVR